MMGHTTNAVRKGLLKDLQATNVVVDETKVLVGRQEVPFGGER
jgi:hypothetical protein